MSVQSTEAACGPLSESRQSLSSTAAGHTGLATSIVIPTFNRRSRLQRLLFELEQQRASGIPFEVVVVVDGADDGSIEMLQMLRPAYPLRVLSQPNAGPAAARNRGI